MSDDRELVVANAAERVEIPLPQGPITPGNARVLAWQITMAARRLDRREALRQRGLALTSPSQSNHVDMATSLIGKKGLTLEAKFWAHTVIGDPDACWSWRGYVGERGYGQISHAGKAIGAHRVSYTIHKGRITDAAPFVCHTCDMRRCVNPNHLYAGTALDNARDALARGRLRLLVVPVEVEEQIRAAYARGEGSQDALALRFQLSREVIRRAVAGILPGLAREATVCI